MRRFRALLLRLAAPLTRTRRERDMASELEAHLQLHIDDHVRAGMTLDEARRRARLALGGVEQTAEACRDARGTVLDSIRQDVTFALRWMRRSPAFTVVAVLSLALGIGANTAIFSILDSLVLRSLPVREPDRLELLTEGEIQTVTNPVWEEIRNRRLFAGACAWQAARFDLARTGEVDRVDGMWASGGLFDVLGVRAVLGRTLTEADDARGGGPYGPVVVISHHLWQRRFGGAPDVIGRALTIDNVPVTVVGVFPASFFGLDVGRSADLVVPLGAMTALRRRGRVLDDRGASFLRVMVRLGRGQTSEAATASVRRVQAAIRAATAPGAAAARYLPPHLGQPFTLTAGGAGTSALRARYQRPLVVLMAGVALVLLAACANIANLLLARAAARRHEFSVRRALGASRARLAGQLFTESVMLAAAGAALGLVFARWGSALLVRQLSTPNGAVFLALPLDWRVLAFAAAAALLTALLFGVGPALRATRAPSHDALKQDDRVAADGRGSRFGSAIVVLQVALSLVLVVGAGLFVRTFSTLVTLDLGLDPDRMLMVTMNRETAAGAPREDGPAWLDRVCEAVSAAPGVAAAAVSAFGPVNDGSMLETIEAPDGVQLGARDLRVSSNWVSPRWFGTLGIPIVAGRDFSETDRAESTPVAIVNEAFARRFYGGRLPVGREFRSVSRGKPGPAVEIVGLVRDAVYGLPRDPVPPTVYRPLARADGGLGYVRLCVRAATASPTSLVRDLSTAILQADPSVRLTFRTLDEELGATVVRERLLAMLTGFFGLLALLLAALGLYGVTSYSVGRRRAEIGIRMALGAAPAQVIRSVLARVVWLVAFGVAVGAGLSAWGAGLVESLLFGVEARDPLTFAAAAAVLVATGLLAGWLPARRAARIDPAIVLRNE